MYIKFYKPFLDFFCALFGLILLSPIFLLIIALQIITIGNPFFFQKRIGKDGRMFKIIKFRSMRDMRDNSGNLLPDENRVTFFGKILRNNSLDELPQLVNILKGEMSLVGPRPLPEYYSRLYNDFQAKRNRVKPGITGVSQAAGGNTISWYSRFRLDVWYTRNVSFCVDFKIIFKTAAYIFAAKQNDIKDIPLDFTGNP